MIQVEVTEDNWNQARERFHKQMNKMNWNRDFDLVQFGYDTNRIYHGLLGEEIIRAYYDCDIPEEESYQYDLLIKGYKVEVKTIVAKFKPQPSYLCLVTHGGEKGERVAHALQDADYYMFVRLQEDLKKAWLVGYMGCDDFINRSKFFKKGSTFKEGKNFEITFDSNVNVLRIRDTIPFRKASQKNMRRQLSFA